MDSEGNDDDIAAGALDRPPFTQVSDWVLLSAISPQAKALYWALAAHSNTAEDAGDGRPRRVWPSRETLATILQLKQALSVDRYLVELVDIGAVKIDKQRTVANMRKRNRYWIRFLPPSDLSWTRSLTEYYARRTSTRSAPQSTTTPTSDNLDTTSVEQTGGST